MDLSIYSTFLPHTDPDASVAFYRDVLGFEVRTDVGYGDMRWITVGPAGQPDTAIVLEPPAADPGVTDDERRTIAEMMAKGSYAAVILATPDLDGTFSRLQASGAEVAQEPTEQPYGVRDCAFRDPAGNLVRINEVRCQPAGERARAHRATRRRPRAASPPRGRPGRRRDDRPRPARARRCTPWTTPWPPARRPARPPTRGSGGAARPASAAAVRNTAGCGLPYSSSSAECTSSKRSRRPKCASAASIRRYCDDEATASGRPRSRHRSMACSAPGLEHALGHDELDHPVDDRHRHLVGRRRGARPRVQPVPVRGDLVHEHALGRAAALDGQRDAETAEDLDLGLVPEDLGVDEQPVHVEDGRGEPRRNGVRRSQAVSCASMSATMVGSSGSTWGR